MKCPNCQTENPEQARFCLNCGSALKRVCPNCATQNPPEARFCLNCGQQLQAGKPPAPAPQLDLIQDRLTRLAAGAPPSLVQKARAAAHMAGERRVVTALFADVVGSTAIAAQFDPEDWTAIMNRAFDLLTPVIYHYEGTIARLMGDALLAFFGAPVAHEDDPVRAAHAALGLLQEAQGYAEELRTRNGFDFAIRIGMNTGPVVVGEVGSSLVYEYTAMGDAVNLASRLQAAARPMTALVTEATYRHIAGFFDCHDLGEIPIKGKADPVHVYEVAKPIQQAERVHRTPGFESPLVGRDSEMATLMRLAQVVQAGLGRAALILGDSGIGKSRLISDWKQRLFASRGEGSPGLSWAEGHCLSYGQGLAYHLLVDLVRSLLGVSPSAEATETLAALQAQCESLFGQDSFSVFPYLGHLLALPLEDEAYERITMLDPQALQSQYLTSLRRLLSAMASRQPLVIVLEDVHWADSSSIDLLIRLVPQVLDHPIFFCLATRPERESPGWRLITAFREQLGAGLTEISLPALSEGESNQLVSNLLDSVELPAALHQLIMAKTEGNPLFVEEVIRMLVDRGILRHEQSGWKVAREVENVDIPDNLQSLLLARIDKLPEDAKQTLRIAAVIGRRFPVRVLEEVLKRRQLAAG